jgi:hypothetical protein
MNPRGPGLFRHAHWILFGLVVSLALSFWLVGARFGKKIEDIYRDPHRHAALKTFEQAIVLAPPGGINALPAAEALAKKFPCADGDRIAALLGQLEAIEARLGTLGRSQTGQVFHLSLDHWPPADASCRGVLEAAAWLAEGQGRRLEMLDWPGLSRTRFETPMRVPDTVFAQDNPWRGADGCVYLGPTADGRLWYLDEQRGHRETCPAMVPPGTDRARVAGIGRKPGEWAKDDPAWAIPDDLGTILADLGRIRRPTGLTYGLYTQAPEADDEDTATSANPAKPHGPNTIPLRGRETDIGFNLRLTLVPETQALVQQWARCYAGDAHACEVLGLNERDGLRRLAGDLYESAAVRMAAVALIDVKSGRIEALGSAHTPCYRQDHDGPGHDPDCPDAPFRPRYDRDRLLNHALYVDAMPASTVKPVMALGFLMDTPAYRAKPALDELWHDLKTSDSAAFLDRLFCGREIDPARRWNWRECRRPERVQEAARLLGWNLECTRESDSPDCAKLDVLFGRPAGKRLVAEARKQPLGLPLLYGRLYTEPSGGPAAERDAPGDDWIALSPAAGWGGYRLMSEFRFELSFARECSAGAFCPGCDHKAWRRCRGVGGKIANEGWGQGEARATPLGVAGMLARLAAAAAGTGAQAFPHLIDHVGDAKGERFELAVERLAEPEPLTIEKELAALVLAGMTSHKNGGTAHDVCRTVFGSQAACDGIGWIAGKTGTPPFRFDESTLPAIRKHCAPDRERPAEDCTVIPYKWYVAAFKTQGDAGAPFDKAIAVLSERNWHKKNGKVQAPGDHGANLSAELAFRIIKALRREPVPPPAAPGPKAGAPQKKKGKP